MRATWRPLATWPYPERTRQVDRFDTGWARTLEDLDAELLRNDADDVVIGVVADPSQFTISGQLRGNAKLGHAGAEVSFNRGGQRVVFHTDAYSTLQSNLRAITLGLAALRAVDRYGITSGSEQWAGFAQLTAGGPDAARGQLLVERAGGVRQALMLHHPDHGGQPRDFADVAEYRRQIEGGP